jgi:hypothetical protein
MTNETNDQSAATPHQCWSCKEKIGPNDAFCPHCGTRLMFDASAGTQPERKTNERAQGADGEKDFSEQARPALTQSQEWRKVNPIWMVFGVLIVCVLGYSLFFSSGTPTPTQRPDLRVEKVRANPSNFMSTENVVKITNTGESPVIIQDLIINNQPACRNRITEAEVENARKERARLKNLGALAEEREWEAIKQLDVLSDHEASPLPKTLNMGEDVEVGNICPTEIIAVSIYTNHGGVKYTWK